MITNKNRESAEAIPLEVIQEICWRYVNEDGMSVRRLWLDFQERGIKNISRWRIGRVLSENNISVKKGKRFTKVGIEQNKKDFEMKKSSVELNKSMSMAMSGGR